MIKMFKIHEVYVCLKLKFIYMYERAKISYYWIFRLSIIQSQIL